MQGQYISNVIKDLEKEQPVRKEYFVDEMVFTQKNVEEYLDNRTY